MSALLEFLSSYLSPLFSIAPYHLLFYSTLLGSALYQSFVMTKVAYLALPRSSFTTLQKKIFPLYFRGQAILLVLTTVTFPPGSLVSMIQHKSDWIPLTVAGTTTLLNLMVYEPRTRKAMTERIHQETRDAKVRAAASFENREPSEEMKKLNRIFSRNHAMSIHLNLISMGALVFYGFRLASKIQVQA
ncbi:hypothetical protein QBC37DRAFT_315467 [Rhypophila decipiens]|uniref:TMEM205-like domain-containing protein n=1 Tax=Rhypophila decipiens TaxID=261697 RepID=A0AAN6YC43_9PEZI|nr:hypothetical protein QBC37DRAFT_315467 [Rhypophila decipiens]